MVNNNPFIYQLKKNIYRSFYDWMYTVIILLAQGRQHAPQGSCEASVEATVTAGATGDWLVDG